MVEICASPDSGINTFQLTFVTWFTVEEGNDSLYCQLIYPFPCFVSISTNSRKS